MVTVVGIDQSAMKQTTCKNCASLLQYTQNEVQEYHDRDISGGADGSEWIDCPKCGQRVILRSW